ncbi:MAG: hypothetical protein KC621_10775 [Myxococcales bacterium]|nr:hypothetical protein [Myxococcales bacterium]
MNSSFLRIRGDDHCLVDADPQTVIRRLREAVDAGRVRGTVRDSTFSVHFPSSGNPWSPVVTGRVVPLSGGTVVEVTLMPNVFVLLVTLAYALPFLGVPWLAAAAAFDGSSGEALQAFATVVGAQAVGREAVAAVQVLADPSLPGAETGAPASLSPRTGARSVSFAVDGWRIEVSSARLRVSRARRSTTLDWAEITSIGAEDATLVLHTTGGDLPLAVPSLPEPHRDWLVRYLRAASRRFGASEQEAARQDAARRELGQLRKRSPE